MAWRSSGKDQKEMNENLKRNGVIRTDPVARAFDIVRTHLFVPSIAGRPAPEVCHDRPIKEGNVHISAPHMYATVLEALNIQPGQSILTVGSGSGYFCTLCATILGPTGVCHGVEIQADVVQHAIACVAKFNLEHQIERKGVPELCTCTFVVGDGFNLSETHNMKYDRIYVAAGAEEADAEFFRRFLAVGGVLVGPFGESLLKICRRTENDFSSQLVTRVMFAPLDRSSLEAAGPKPKVLLTLPLWTPALAFRFPANFNQSAACLAVLQRRPTATGGVLSVLPPALIYHILTFCTRDWFIPEIPLVERLMNQLREEIKAREEAETRAVELQRERDEAMMLCMYLRAQLRNMGPPPGLVPVGDDAADDADDTEAEEEVLVRMRPNEDGSRNGET